MTRFPYSYQMQQLFQIVSITITIGSYDFIMFPNLYTQQGRITNI